MDTNTSPQPREKGAMMPPMFITPDKQPNIDVTEYTRHQTLLTLQKPEMQISNEEFKKTDKIFHAQSVNTPISDDDKKLLTKVQEFKRLVGMLSEKDREKLAEDDINKENMLKMIAEELTQPSIKKSAESTAERKTA